MESIAGKTAGTLFSAVFITVWSLLRTVTRSAVRTVTRSAVQTVTRSAVRTVVSTVTRSLVRTVVRTIIVLTIVSTFVLVFALAGSQTVHAATISVTNNYEVDDIIYALYYDDTYGSREAWANVYTGSGGQVTVPESVTYEGEEYAVTEIGSEAFEGATGITSVTLPGTIFEIGELAFCRTGITEITIPEGVRWIDNSSFSDCAELTAVTLPSTLNLLEAHAFCGCRKLSDLTCYVPSRNNLYVGEAAFGCWYDENDDLVYTDGSQLIVHAYGGDIVEYAQEHSFGIEWIPEPVKEIRLKADGNLAPKFGDTVSTPSLSVSSTDSHAWGKLTASAEWLDRYGNTMSDGSEVDTDAMCLSIMIEVDESYFDFSKTKIYINDLEITVKGSDTTWIYATYGDIDTGAVKLDVKAECKGNSEGQVSLDDSNYDSEYSTLSKNGKSCTFYAKAGDGSVFLEWRKDDPDTGTVAGTDPTLTFSVSGNAVYYAVFGKSLPASGTLNERAKYTFDAGTGTVTISPVGWTEGEQSIQMGEVPDTPFNGTQKVKHVVFENGFSIIDDELFIDEDSIESVSIPSSVSSTGVYKYNNFCSAFARCTLVGTGFTVNADNPYLKSEDGSLYSKDGKTLYTYFRKTGATEYTVEDTTTMICQESFDGVTLDKLTLQGEGLTLEDYAIRFCKIKDIEIKEGVVSLGSYGDNTGPTSVTLPSTIEYAEQHCAVLGAPTLKSIDVAEGNTHFRGIGGVLYKINSNGDLVLYKFPLSKDASDFTTPEGVVEIMSYAFRFTKTPMNIILKGDVINVRYRAFMMHGPLTLTVENPGCTFESVAIDSAYDIKIRAAEGSIAHQLYQEHQDDPRWSFEATETSTTPLGKPKNFSWDGDTLKWSAVSGANSYKVEVHKEDPDGNASMVTYDPVTVSGPSFTFDESAYDCYWYKTDKYWCTVTAYGAGYLPSSEAVSPKRPGNYYTVSDLDAELTGDMLEVAPYTEPYIQEHDQYLRYGVDFYNKSNYCVVDDRHMETNDPVMDLRAIAKVYSLPKSEEYRIVVTAYTGRNSYTSVPVSKSKEFTWYYGEKDISECTFPDSLPDFTFNGKPHCPGIKVFDGDKLLTEDKDYKIEGRKNIDAGTAELVISGLGDYGSAKVLTFTIKPAKLKDATLGKIPDVTYTGSALKPVPPIKLDSYKLKSGTDFTVSYSKNKNVGKGTAEIKGKGNFTGTVSGTFKVIPKGISISKLYKGSRSITVKWKKQSAKMSTSRITGYQIQAATNKDFTSGKKTVKVKGYKKTKKKISKLKKKKTYYVRIRTYKTVSGTTYYSEWSKVKSIKTK